MNWSDLITGPPLRWVQTSMMKMNYQLVRGNQVITTLRFKGFSGSLATVENADGSWTFKRTGFWQAREIILASGSEREIATFRHNTWKGGGTLEFQGGRQILATTNLWTTKLEFQEASGEILMRFKYDSVWCTAATLGIQASALSAPETSWMVAFGWYLMVMMQMDASGAAVAAVSPVF
jgi:hypothetical protein